MLMGARRVTIRLSAHAPVPLDVARVTWGDGDRIDLPRDQLALLQADTAVLLSHVYLCASTPYPIEFTVVDTDGQQATATVSVLVRNQPPLLTLMVEIEGQLVTVTPTASDSDGEIIDLSLYWGGREGVVHGATSGQPLSHQYPDDGGLWPLLATATDDEGASTTVRQYVALLSAEEAAAQWGISPGARSRERNETP
jgi:hypothetical protein